MFKSNGACIFFNDIIHPLMSGLLSPGPARVIARNGRGGNLWVVRIILMTCRKGRKDCRSSGGGLVKTDEFGGGIRLEFTLNSTRIQAEFSKYKFSMPKFGDFAQNAYLCSVLM